MDCFGARLIGCGYGKRCSHFLGTAVALRACEKTKRQGPRQGTTELYPQPDWSNQMENQGSVQRRTRSLILGIGFWIAAALSIVGFGMLRCRPMDFRGCQALLTTVVVAMIVLLWFVWQHRVRAVARWKTILDTYAEREIARDRRRQAPATWIEPDGRNSTSFKTLKDRLVGELTDRAYPIVLRQGVMGLSVDVELAVWKAIDGTLQEMLKPFLAGTAQTPPASGIVLARLTKAVYQVAQRRGFRGSFADVEFGLWDAFHTGSFPGYAKEQLRIIFRKASEALEA
jgi:hypothetical protein